LRVLFRALGFPRFGGAVCESKKNTSKPIAFEVSSKRRKGFPSETHVQRGDRVVGGSKELLEKLGRNDPCPCGSGRRFQALLHAGRRARWVGQTLLFQVERLRALGNVLKKKAGPEGGEIACISDATTSRVGPAERPCRDARAGLIRHGWRAEEQKKSGGAEALPPMPLRLICRCGRCTRRYPAAERPGGRRRGKALSSMLKAMPFMRECSADLDPQCNQCNIRHNGQTGSCEVPDDARDTNALVHYLGAERSFSRNWIGAADYFAVTFS
jgi:hypothetical protein